MSTSPKAAIPKLKVESKEKFQQQMVEVCDEQQEDFGLFVERISSAFCEYGRRRPGVAAMAILGLGFFVGWKVKPW